VYLRNHSYNHPVAVVYDDVVSTNPDFKKTYLLHSIKEPEIDGNLVKITIDEGIDENNKAVLYQETLLPNKAKISKVGGRENNQEFLVWDDGTGKPHNYNEEATYKNPSKRQIRELREAGEWRVEVSPFEAKKSDKFLNVISVNDDEKQYKPVQTQYVSSDNIDGVIVKDNDNSESTLVLFCKGDIQAETIKLDNALSFNKILITGLSDKTNYSVNQEEGKLIIDKKEDGKLQSSEQGTIYIDHQE
jgi:heparin/heparan-sulfate lyase